MTCCQELCLFTALLAAHLCIQNGVSYIMHGKGLVHTLGLLHTYNLGKLSYIPPLFRNDLRGLLRSLVAESEVAKCKICQEREEYESHKGNDKCQSDIDCLMHFVCK